MCKRYLLRAMFSEKSLFFVKIFKRKFSKICVSNLLRFCVSYFLAKHKNKFSQKRERKLYVQTLPPRLVNAHCTYTSCCSRSAITNPDNCETSF